MPTIVINQKEYFYNESEIINFAEGLIGMPKLRRAALIPLDEFQPFCWLASIDDEESRFIVVNPNAVFGEYQPQMPEEFVSQIDEETKLETLTIVKISSDWKKTTVNLRAPIFVNRKTKRGVQYILTESNYTLAESLPNI